MVRLAIVGVGTLIASRVFVTHNNTRVIQSMGEAYAQSIRTALGTDAVSLRKTGKQARKDLLSNVLDRVRISQHLVPQTYREYYEQHRGDNDPTFEEWWTSQ